MKKQALALAVCALTASALMSGSPAQGHHDQGSHKNTFTADETGCRNVIDGSFGQFQRLVDRLVLKQDPVTGFYTGAENELLDRGVARASLTLEAPSCADVTYTLNVYRAELQTDGSYVAGGLLGSTSRPGNGVDGASTPFYVSTGIEFLPDDPEKLTVMLQVEVSDASGVHDYAPAAPDAIAAAEDGSDEGGSGAAGWN